VNVLFTIAVVVAAALWGLAAYSRLVRLRALEHHGALDSFNGRVAVGWLIVEDLAMVLVLVLLPPLASVLTGKGLAPGESLWREIAVTLLQVGLFVTLMLVVGRRLFPWVPLAGPKVGPARAVPPFPQPAVAALPARTPPLPSPFPPGGTPPFPAPVPGGPQKIMPRGMRPSMRFICASSSLTSLSARTSRISFERRSFTFL